MLVVEDAEGYRLIAERSVTDDALGDFLNADLDG